MSKVEYNEKLSQQLKSLPHRKILYTDSHYQHVEETLKILKLHGFFEHIYTVSNGNYVWKKHKGAFERFINHYNISPFETIIFEDSLANLKIAKNHGLLQFLSLKKLLKNQNFVILCLII